MGLQITKNKNSYNQILLPNNSVPACHQSCTLHGSISSNYEVAQEHKQSIQDNIKTTPRKWLKYCLKCLEIYGIVHHYMKLDLKIKRDLKRKVLYIIVNQKPLIWFSCILYAPSSFLSSSFPNATNIPSRKCWSHPSFSSLLHFSSPLHLNDFCHITTVSCTRCHYQPNPTQIPPLYTLPPFTLLCCHVAMLLVIQ